MASSDAVKMEEFQKLEVLEPEKIKVETPTKASPTTPTTPASSATRRPTRKSTLTQQQKNHKRQRATQEQLGLLEVEFNKNPTPTAAVRETIAQNINMTERSVQIWFQNRRAKIKNLAKRSIETGEDCDAIPDSMRKYLAMQALESGKPIMRDMNGAIGGYGGGLLMNADSNASKVVIYHFACRSLNIGSWRRIGQTALDLVVFYSPAKSMLTYYINADASGFKIEFPFSYIKSITLDSGDISSNAEGASQQFGGLIVELNRPPMFSMDPGSGGFFQCRDFTENAQASQVLTHYLGGHPKVLSGQLTKLVSLDSFRNRHEMAEPNPVSMPIAMPISMPGPVPVPMLVPVAEPILRPVSQPNCVKMLNFRDDTTFNMGPPPPRGHKRQRSRSVPAAIDIAQFRQQTQPLFMRQGFQPLAEYQQQDFEHDPSLAGVQPHGLILQLPPQPQPRIYAPIPQHPGMMHQHNKYGNYGQTNYGTTYNINLNIDLPQNTSIHHNFDFRQPPMSATAANSIPECERSFFPSTAATSDSLSTKTVSTPFSVPFSSPGADPSSLAQQSVSPLSVGSHQGGPVIVSQSLQELDRSMSADVYSTPQEQDDLDDDAFGYGMFSKQTFTLPFRNSLTAAVEEDFGFSNMLNYDDVDSTAISNEDYAFSNCTWPNSRQPTENSAASDKIF